MAQCGATTKQGERCKNSCVSGSSYCLIHDRSTRQSRRVEQSYVLTREEVLKFVEFDLWGRVRTRLFALVGTVAVLATLAGLFGIPYYINNELTTRLQESTIEFDQKTTEILRHAKLLVLVSVTYDRELGRLRRDIDSLIESIERYNDGKVEEEQIGTWTVQGIKDLKHLEDYHTAGQGFPSLHVSMPEEHGSIEIVTRKLIRMRIIVSTGETGSSHGHPIHDGTLKGVVDDITFRVVSLEAFRRTMNALRKNLLELGGETPIQKRVERVGVISLFEENFSSNYQEKIRILAKEALSEKESTQLARHESLYLISVSIGE